MTSANPLDVITLRKALGLSQGQLAQALGTSRRTIHRWEQGGMMHLIWQDRLTTMYRDRFPQHEPPRLLTRRASAS